MAILKRIPPQFYQCVDGTYSTHNRRGACNWHGGLKNTNPLSVSKGRSSNAGIELIPIQSIGVNHGWFQNRATPYSARSVENIVAAAQGGTFRWVNFDPITVWANRLGKLYVLSGHSRLEAFVRLCKAGVKAEGRVFCEIPAKVAKGLTMEQAKKIALESNTLSTKETLLERSIYYRRLTPSKSFTELKEIAKRLEGANANKILAYAHLSATGKTLAALQALENKDEDSNSTMGKVARWIGNARIKYPLTDQHENEIYDWLINMSGYGTGRGQLSNEKAFNKRLYNIIQKRTEFGALSVSLNIKNTLYQSPVERQYNEQLREAMEKVKELEKQLKAKIANLASRGADELKIKELTKGLEASLRRARIDYQNIVARKDHVTRAAKNELSLFENISGIRRYGKFLYI